MGTEPEPSAPQLPQTVRVSPHAVERFRERTGSKKMDETIRRRLLSMLAGAEEVKLKPPYNVVALLNHDFRDARYFRSGGFILVVEGDCISTVHHGEARRWEQFRASQK